VLDPRDVITYVDIILAGLLIYAAVLGVANSFAGDHVRAFSDGVAAAWVWWCIYYD